MPRNNLCQKSNLSNLDCNKVLVSKWAKPKDETHIWCTPCSKDVTVSHSGLGQINQHAGGKDHKALSVARFSSAQPRFTANSNGQLVKPSAVQVSEAECLWAFKLAEED